MDPMVMILIIGGGFVLILLAVGIVVTARSERSLVEERLGRYWEAEKVEEKKAERASPIGEWVDRRLARSTLGGGIGRELARADLKLKPGEYIATMVILAVGFGFILYVLYDRNSGFPVPIYSIAGAMVGVMLPRIYVRYRQSQRLIRFNDQLADTLNLMVNGLKAGFSIMQAMEAVSREMPPPVCDEFRRVVQEMQLGLPMDLALANLLRRIPSDDLDLVITAINVQREVGGNLAEILDTISYTIRERVRIKGEIRVLTSQVMYSGRFLSLMPVLIFAILWLLNPNYMREFFTVPIVGYIALGTAVLMIASGYYVMNRIANIEV